MFEKTHDEAAVEEAFGERRHPIKAAQQLNKLADLLRQDQNQGGSLLSADDRNVALAEIRNLLKALNAPDQSGVVTKGPRGYCLQHAWHSLYARHASRPRLQSEH